MDFLYSVTADPVLQIVEDPVFFLQIILEGLMAGVMYSLVALGFCLIYKASGVFNFAQGVMMVLAVMCMVTVYDAGFGILLALLVAMVFMVGLSFAIERVVLRPMVNQPQIILFMATIGLAFFLEGFGEFIFGGSFSPAPMGSFVGQLIHTYIVRAGMC